MTSNILFILDKTSNIHIPDLPRHNILDFLGYKLYNGKYVKKIPKKLHIYKLLLERPSVKYLYNSCMISFDIDFRDYHNDWVVKTMEIRYFINRKYKMNYRKYKINYNYYAIDFNQKRYKYEPSIPW